MCAKIKYSPNTSVISVPGRGLSDIAIIDK